MDRAPTADTELGQAPNSTASTSSAQRMFSISMVVSGIRCLLAYIVLPFVTPFLSLAPGVGPILGIVIGTIAIGANVWSMRRFWRLQHPWRKQVTVIHLMVIGLLVVLVALDIAELVA